MPSPSSARPPDSPSPAGESRRGDLDLMDQFGAPRLLSITSLLIALNILAHIANIVAALTLPAVGYVVAIFIQQPDGSIARADRLLVMPAVEAWGHFSTSLAIVHGQVWRVITFQFLHANLYHLGFNMFSLFMFAPIVEKALGWKRFLVFYLLCGIGGAVAYNALWTIGWLVTYPWTPLVGASAGIFGVLVAAARLAPHGEIVLIWPPVPLRIRTFVTVMMLVAIYTVLMFGRNAGGATHNAGGEAAHLGGAIVGWFLMRRLSTVPAPPVPPTPVS